MGSNSAALIRGPNSDVPWLVNLGRSITRDSPDWRRGAVRDFLSACLCVSF